MIINVEEIQAHIKAIDEFNNLNFDEIEWREGGEEIKMKPEANDEWKFTGLSNASFVRHQIWRDWQA